jgi:hypothetical protein
VAILSASIGNTSALLGRCRFGGTNQLWLRFEDGREGKRFRVSWRASSSCRPSLPACTPHNSLSTYSSQATLRSVTAATLLPISPAPISQTHAAPWDAVSPGRQRCFASRWQSRRAQRLPSWCNKNQFGGTYYCDPTSTTGPTAGLDHRRLHKHVPEVNGVFARTHWAASCAASTDLCFRIAPCLSHRIGRSLPASCSVPSHLPAPPLRITPAVVAIPEVPGQSSLSRQAHYPGARIWSALSDVCAP